MFKKLELPDPTPTNVTLQLADCALTYPREIGENMLVKMEELI